MRKFLVAVLAAGAFGSAMAQPGVNLWIGINQQGVYGQINIGNLPPAALIAPRPVVVAPVVVGAAPIYLYVPVAEQRNWHRHCHRYDACGRPVYFVRENWVRERYAHEHPGWDRGRGHDGRHDNRREGRGDHERRD